MPTATSLALAGAPAVDRAALLGRGARPRFADWYDAWVGAAGQGLRPAYVRACTTLGREVRVDLPGGEPLRGRAVDVDDDGRLLVDDGRAGARARGR